MASTINASNSGSGGLISTGDASGVLQLQTASTAALTIDASQNVGIGVTPSATSSGKAVEIGTVGNTLWGIGAADLQISAGTYYNGANKYAVTGSAVSAYELVAGSHRWYYAASGTAGNTATFSESMRIDSSGRVCIGVNSAAYSTACAMNVNVDTVSSGGGAWVSKCTGTGTVFHLNFQNGNGGVGGISTSASATQYVTSSDYRLKESITPMTGALAKVAQLKPVTYKWKVDGSDGEGFIAHELAEVKPDCVSGDKDAVDADGNPKYQGIDVSFLVATLTAALQETKALIDTQAETINALTARIVALETK